MTLNPYTLNDDLDSSIDSLPSILSERPSQAFIRMSSYTLSPKILLTANLHHDKRVNENKEFIRKSVNINFKPPFIGNNGLVSYQQEYILEINDQNLLAQMNNKYEKPQNPLRKKFGTGIVKTTKNIGESLPAKSFLKKVHQAKGKTENQHSTGSTEELSYNLYHDKNMVSSPYKILDLHPQETSQKRTSHRNLNIEPKEEIQKPQITINKIQASANIPSKNLHHPSKLNETIGKTKVLKEDKRVPVKKQQLPAGVGKENVKTKDEEDVSSFEIKIIEKETHHKIQNFTFAERVENFEFFKHPAPRPSVENEILPREKEKKSIHLSKSPQSQNAMSQLQQKFIVEEPVDDFNLTQVESFFEDLQSRKVSVTFNKIELNETVYYSPCSDKSIKRKTNQNRSLSPLKKAGQVNVPPQSTNTSFVSCLSNDEETSMEKENNEEQVEKGIGNHEGGSLENPPLSEKKSNNQEFQSLNIAPVVKIESERSSIYEISEKTSEQDFFSLSLHKESQNKLSVKTQIVQSTQFDPLVTFLGNPNPWKDFNNEARKETNIVPRNLNTRRQGNCYVIPPFSFSNLDNHMNEESELNEQSFANPAAFHKVHFKETSPLKSRESSEQQFASKINHSPIAIEIQKKSTNYEVSIVPELNDSSTVNQSIEQNENECGFSIDQTLKNKFRHLNGSPKFIEKHLNPVKREANLPFRAYTDINLDVAIHVPQRGQNKHLHYYNFEKTEELKTKEKEIHNFYPKASEQPKPVELNDDDSDQIFLSQKDQNIFSGRQNTAANKSKLLISDNTLPVIEEVSSTQFLGNTTYINAESLQLEQNKTSFSIYSDYFLTEPDPEISKIFSESLDNLSFQSVDHADFANTNNLLGILPVTNKFFPKSHKEQMDPCEDSIISPRSQFRSQERKSKNSTDCQKTHSLQNLKDLNEGRNEKIMIENFEEHKKFQILQEKEQIKFLTENNKFQEIQNGFRKRGLTEFEQNDLMSLISQQKSLNPTYEKNTMEFLTEYQNKDSLKLSSPSGKLGNSLTSIPIRRTQNKENVEKIKDWTRNQTQQYPTENRLHPNRRFI